MTQTARTRDDAARMPLTPLAEVDGRAARRQCGTPAGHGMTLCGVYGTVDRRRCDHDS